MEWLALKTKAFAPGARGHIVVGPENKSKKHEHAGITLRRGLSLRPGHAGRGLRN